MDSSTTALDWDPLMAELEIPLLGPAWFRAATASFRLAPQCRVLSADGGDCEAALPLVRRTRLGLPWLELAGARELHEPMELPLKSNARDRSINALRAYGLPLLLQRLRRDDPLMQAASRLSGAGLRYRLGRHSCTFNANTTLSWTGYLAERSPRRRADLRRAFRRAGGEESVTLEVVSPSQREFPTHFQRFLDIEDANWKGRNGSSLVRRPELRQFFEMLGGHLSGTGRLKLFFLRIDGRLAAAQYCLLENARLWTLKVGYDEEFARCSPGLLLTSAVIRHCCESEISGYEFLGTDESWVRPWATGSREFVDLYLFPDNAAGMTALALFSLRTWAVRLLSRLRRS